MSSKNRSIRAEQEVLGALMLDPAAIKAVGEIIDADDFTRDDHRKIFRAITQLEARGAAIDPVSIGITLEQMGEAGALAYSATIAKETWRTSNVVSHARKVRELSIRRQLENVVKRIAAEAANPDPQAIAKLEAEITAAKQIAAGLTNPSPSTQSEKTYNLLAFDDLAALPPMKWRVKGVLPESGVTAIYGPSGSGKSFLALDLAGAIGAGREWFGHRVNMAPVVYVCLEGQSGLRNRVAAYRTQHGGDSLAGVRFILEPFHILNGDAAALVRTIQAAGLEKPVIVIDTLNRAAPGADENSGVDMGRIIEAAHIIQQATGGLVALVHHSGKDSAKGMRGHSSLHAALDAVIEVKRDGENREWSLAKAKDGTDGVRFAFALRVHHLGEDSDGDPITSCYVVPDGTGGTETGTKREPLGRNGTKAVEILADLYDQRRANLAESGKDPNEAYVSLGDWSDALRELGKMPKNRAYDARTEARKKGYVRFHESYVYLVPESTETVPIGTGTDRRILVPKSTALPIGERYGTGTGTDRYGTDAATDGFSNVYPLPLRQNPTTDGTGTDSWENF